MKRAIFIFFFTLIISCTNNDIGQPFDCSTVNLVVTLTSKTNPTSCKAKDGNLIVDATGGSAPFEFSLNGDAFQKGNQFSDLGSGAYNVIVKDANGCKATSATIDISAPNSNLDASAVAVKNNQCTSPNGSITVTASGGVSPYSFQTGTGGFVSSSVFNNLKEGAYTITVKDANDCLKTIPVTVPRENTNTSYLNQVKPILEASCNLASCHGAGTGSRDWTNFANLKSRAASVKSRTVNRSMPPSGSSQLTQAQIDLIACWVDDGALNN